MLTSYPKAKLEDGQMEALPWSIGKRRSSHQSSEHELEEQINEWANMTGFLCALGGVCLQRKSPTKQVTNVGVASQNVEFRKCSSVLAGSSQDVQYCPVTQ